MEYARRNHDISELWDIMKAKPLPEASEEEESFEIVEGCLMEFHSLDKKGLAFRYPERMKLQQVDLGNLKSVMGGVSAFLDAVADQWEDGIYNKS